MGRSLDRLAGADGRDFETTEVLRASCLRVRRGACPRAG